MDFIYISYMAYNTPLIQLVIRSTLVQHKWKDRSKTLLGASFVQIILFPSWPLISRRIQVCCPGRDFWKARIKSHRSSSVWLWPSSLQDGKSVHLSATSRGCGASQVSACWDLTVCVWKFSQNNHQRKTSAVDLGVKTHLSLFYIQNIFPWSTRHNLSLRRNPDADLSSACSFYLLIEKDSANFLSQAD